MTELSASSTFDYKAWLKNITSKPGVYRMLNEKGDVIYVGKAKNLKKRVSSYFTKSDQTAKTRVMVAQIRAIDVTVTHTENEALILENNLIKSLKPQYNVLFRDDKTYPYIYLSAHQDFPRLSYYRGARKEKGKYFGPYPSAGAVRESLNLLQKVFRVRQCEDSFFNNRTRPCLQYQIKRCTGPCVNFITKEAYAEDVEHAVMFLEGKSTQVIDGLVAKMERAAEQLSFEKAAAYRDQIVSLRKVQEKQYISSGPGNNIDIIAAVVHNGMVCVQVFYIRDGQNLGNKSFFPGHALVVEINEVLAAFIAQYYLGKQTVRDMPSEIITNIAPTDKEWLSNALTEQSAHKLVISSGVRGERSRWVRLAESNAEIALAARMQSKANFIARFEALQDELSLETMPQRLECFDISHTMGEATVASCVVCDINGLVKEDYRLFNIKDITPGDDYAAMKQALDRRYRRLKEGEGKLPDILIIDGGKGQLSQAEQILEELQITGVIMLGVAKGVERKPGAETLFLSGMPKPFILPPTSMALHLIQQVRDEAHRFAITGHRQRRGKKRQTSTLEEIPGLGPKRRQQLLKQFGGLQGIISAGVEDLLQVKGISKELAQKIYDQFHLDT